MKNTDTTFKDYLKTITKVDLHFDQMQSQILQENLGYSKTRYRIISTTFQKILEGHPEFKELLFFICLIDAQNIPKELLYQCQTKQCVDEFLYYLKQHSFIEGNREYFSIHRSIQEKGLTCILNILTQSEINCYLQKILSALTPPLCWFYCPNAKHYSKDSHFLIPHLKILLYKIDRIHFIEPIYKDKIISQILLTLGHIYYVWNSYMQIAENYYRCILEKDQYKNALSIYDQAVLYLNLGHALLIEGKYKDGGIYIKKSLELTCHFENPKPLKIMGLALLSLYYAYAKPFSNKYKEIASQALNLLTKPKEPWKFYVQYHLFDIIAGNHLSNPLSPTDILLGRDYSLKSAELMGRLHNNPPLSLFEALNLILY